MCERPTPWKIVPYIPLTAIDLFFELYDLPVSSLSIDFPNSRLIASRTSPPISRFPPIQPFHSFPQRNKVASADQSLTVPFVPVTSPLHHQ
jgi:hypothetical protein